MNEDNNDNKVDILNDTDSHIDSKNKDDEELITSKELSNENVGTFEGIVRRKPDVEIINEMSSEKSNESVESDTIKEDPIPDVEVKTEKIASQVSENMEYPPHIENTRYTESPAPKKKSRTLQYITIAAVLFFIVTASFALIYQTFNGDLYPSDDKIAVIYVQGTLITSSIPGGLGYATSEDISKNIRDAVNDEDVKAIVLRVNSPGGSSTAGGEIYTEVKRASDSGMPVIVSMGDVAASAAYHISAPADLIVANPSTMTGSIGTIWTFQNLSGFYEEEGISFYVAKSGEFKDMGATWRGLSDDEKEYADKVIVEVYTSFIEDVAQGRGMSVGEVKDLADGRIYTGIKAKELGLVDEFGNLYDAIDRAAEIGGIEGEPTVVYMNKPSLSSLLFGSEADTSAAVDQYLSYYEESPYGKIE
jgi:protease-4